MIGISDIDDFVRAKDIAFEAIERQKQVDKEEIDNLPKRQRRQRREVLAEHVAKMERQPRPSYLKRSTAHRSSAMASGRMSQALQDCGSR